MAAEINDTELEGVLKNVYQNLRVKAFPVMDPIVAQIKKQGPGGARNFRWGGNGVIWDMVVDRPVGATYSQRGFFPPHAQVTERQASAGIKRLYVTREIDGLLPVATEDTKAAYKRIAAKVVEEAKDAYKLQMAETIHGDGTAVKALVTAVNSTTEIEVSSPYGVSGAGEGGLHLAKGMYLAVLDASVANAVLGKATVSAVVNDGDTATLTLDTAVAGMAAGDKLVPATTSDTAFEAAPDGLIKMTNRGGNYVTANGLSCTDWPHLAPVRMVAGTDTPDVGQPTESDLWRLFTKVKGKSGKDATQKPKEFLLVTTPGLALKLAETFYGQRGYTMAQRTTLHGGFEAITINGVAVISDFMCPAGTVYLIHLPSLAMIDAKDFGQVGYNDANVWRPISGRDAYQTSWSQFFNIAATQRNTLGSIVGYADTERFSFVA